MSSIFNLALFAYFFEDSPVQSFPKMQLEERIIFFCYAITFTELQVILGKAKFRVAHIC